MELRSSDNNQAINNNQYLTIDNRQQPSLELKQKWAKRDFAELETILMIISREHGLSDEMLTTLNALLSYAGTRKTFSCSYKSLYKLLRKEINEGDINDNSKIKNIYRRIKSLKLKQEEIGITYFSHKTPTDEERMRGIASEFNIEPISTMILEILKVAREDHNYRLNPGKTVTETAQRIAKQIYQDAKPSEPKPKKIITTDMKLRKAHIILLNIIGDYANDIDPDDPIAIRNAKERIEEIIESFTKQYSSILTNIFGEHIDQDYPNDTIDTDVHWYDDENTDQKTQELPNSEIVLPNTEVSQVIHACPRDLSDEILLSHTNEAIRDNVQASDHIVTLSNFYSIKDNKPKQISLSWQQFCKRLESPVIRRDKDGNAFSTALFEGTRSKNHAVSMGMIGIDCDKDLTFDEAMLVTKQMHCAFSMYSTHSHSAAQDRFRIMFPLKRPIDSSEFTILWKYLVESIYQSKNDQNCSDPSRMWYWPAIKSKDSPYRTYIHDGDLLDPDYILKLALAIKNERQLSNQVVKEISGNGDPLIRVEKRQELFIDDSMLSILSEIQLAFKAKYPKYYKCWKQYAEFLKFNKSNRSSADQAFINYHLQRGFNREDIAVKLFEVSEKAMVGGSRYVNDSINNGIQYVVNHSWNVNQADVEFVEIN